MSPATVTTYSLYRKYYSHRFLLSLLFGLIAGFMFGLSFDVCLDKILGQSSNEFDVSMHFKNGKNESIKLTNSVKILCWVMTSPKNHELRAIHVKQTWGKRCDKLLFMSTEDDHSLPAIKLNVTEGYNYLWYKTKAAFEYVYKHHFDEVDWFLKADDDTYVIMDNLRHFLSYQNKSKAIYFGCKIKEQLLFFPITYVSGGAGYVLSKEALRLLMQSKSWACSAIPGPEDLRLGLCLSGLSIETGDTRDAVGRGRFFPLSAEMHLLPGNTKYERWYERARYYRSEPGMNCCSDTAISFHYVNPQMMYVFEYLLYHMKLVKSVNSQLINN